MCAFVHLFVHMFVKERNGKRERESVNLHTCSLDTLSLPVKSHLVCRTVNGHLSIFYHLCVCVCDLGALYTNSVISF